MRLDIDEGQMYPGVEDPTYTTTFSNFSELTEAVGDLDETFNQIQSWFITDYDGEHLFHLYVFMPRKMKTLYWHAPVTEIDDVQGWIDNFAKPRILAWYGLTNKEN